jgi:hypothetical protein
LTPNSIHAPGEWVTICTNCGEVKARGKTPRQAELNAAMAHHVCKPLAERDKDPWRMRQALDNHYESSCLKCGEVLAVGKNREAVRAHAEASDHRCNAQQPPSGVSPDGIPWQIKPVAYPPMPFPPAGASR